MSIEQRSELQTRLLELGESPKDNGTLEMIVCRPTLGERRILNEATLDIEDGLVGDNWKLRETSKIKHGNAYSKMQIAIMNSRVIQAIAQDKSRWSLAGDQLFVDLDLSSENLPPDQQIVIGTVILEVTEVPHNGCVKFTERYGSNATKFVNSVEGRLFRYRGINARIVRSGTIKIDDRVTKI